MLYVAYHITVQVIAHLSLHLYIHSINNIPYQLIKNKKPEKGKAISINFTDIREFDSCIIKIVRAGRIKPVLFLSSFSLYYLVIFSDM